MNKMTSFLLETELFSGMSGEEIQSCCLQLGTHRKSYKKGDLIIKHLRPVPHAGLLLHGEARASMPNYDGSEYHLHYYPVGSLLAAAYAMKPQERIPMDISAATDCEILWMNLHEINSVLLLRNLLRLTAQSYRAQNLKMRILSQKGIRARLISYIRAEGLADEQGVVELPFNRESLANYLGVERSALSRELSRMRDEGLLDYRKNQLVFKNKELLRVYHSKEKA